MLGILYSCIPVYVYYFYSGPPRPGETLTAGAMWAMRTIGCLILCYVGVGIAKFVFLIKFTVDVGEVDLECDADKYSAMDTWLIMAWVEWGVACCGTILSVVIGILTLGEK